MANRDSRTQPLSAYLAFHTFAACLGGLNAGINLGNLNTPRQVISLCKGIPEADRDASLKTYVPCWPQTDGEDAMNSMWGFVASSLAIGGFIGALASTPLAMKLGRKYAIMVNNLLFIIGGVLMALSNGPAQFGAGRFLSGVATGAATSIVSTYVSEIAVQKYRGALGTCLQLNVVIGILLAAGFGVPLSTPEANSESGLGWRINVAIVVIPALLQVILMFFCVEAPRYLVSNGRLVEAKAALQKLRGFAWNIEYEFADILKSQGYSVDSADVSQLKSDAERSAALGTHANGADVEKNVANVKAPVASSKSSPMSFLEVVGDSRLRKMLLIAVGIHFCQQITGINSIIMYSTSIFDKAYPDISGILTLGVSLVNLASTFPAVVLVEKFGRRSLMGFGLLGMTLFTATVLFGMLCDLPVVIVLGINLFVACFAVGLGPIPFLIIPELFPTKAVAVAAGLANFVNYMSNWVVVMTFPMYEKPLGNFVFVPFLAFAALGTFFVFTCVPETKGKTLKDLGMADEED
ncbi:MAG: major facilitator superfamily domain-containing protein [Olpidium bornovanus]|uniref:Major facilitator superfamily domain-containing protein n=1 Tax=Olpidium bornovanus TaxID=278681 RepID=A0A8H7ZQG2_9FUNG|nr:MAG: major facilitator superfamily domain-containing protein [Olpidium bornovanus]